MKRSRMIVQSFVVALIMVGCNMPLAPAVPPSVPTITSLPASPTPAPTVIPPTLTPTEIPAPVHIDLPGAPMGKVYQTVHDQVNEKTAPKKEANGGDDFRNGKYERPFDQSMNYLPLTDLVSVQLSREDPLWIYVLFKVDKPFSTQPSAQTNYMIEIDTNLDSRGDLLIVTGTPKSTQWSTESVLVYTAPDMNVGGQMVVLPDPTLSEGRGYYEEIFNNGKGEDPDLAWSRLSKIDTAVAQIAFKNTLVGGDNGKFIWLPWADAGMLDWTLFDYNDHFTFKLAGYPMKDDMENYPLKELWGVDNTCRMPSGFTPDKTLVGLCPNYDPPPSQGKPNCTKICINTGKQTICTCK